MALLIVERPKRSDRQVPSKYQSTAPTSPRICLVGNDQPLRVKQRGNEKLLGALLESIKRALLSQLAFATSDLRIAWM